MRKRIDLRVKLIPGQDDDLIQWWHSIPEGHRGYEVRRLLRLALQLASQPAVPRADPASQGMSQGTPASTPPTTTAASVPPPIDPEIEKFLDQLDKPMEEDEDPWNA